MKLYEPFPDSITVDGREYRLTLWFDRVIRYFDLLGDDRLTPEEITAAGFAWLVDCPRPPAPEVCTRVLRCIEHDIIAPPRRQLSSRRAQKRAVDFTFDAQEIYASFMRDYGIDLVKERGRLHWCAFIALFNGLSDDTPIRRIMRIRTEEMPAPTRSNAKQLQTLTELKTLYALPDSGREHADNWDGLFDMLLGQAEKGGG